ncbi:hypothetical protein ACKVMT_09870 [Halobacteriales archaeon Cl-PHB]
MLLLVAYSQAARQSLRNVCRRHEDCVVRRFGRAALFAETEFGAFQAIRLRERHGRAIQVERTRPFNEFDAVDEAVREAAAAYEDRETAATPYARFAAGTDHPSQDAMKDADL